MKTSPLVPSSHRLALPICALGIALAATLGCGGASASSSGGGGTTTTGSLMDVRGDRYCEILIGKLGGVGVHIEVYNTYPLNDCPQDAWAAVDPAEVKGAQMADAVILNGPRYWTMDAFANTSLIDDTPRTLGGLPMRLAGTLDLPLSQVQAGEMPYAPRDVTRTTSWIYEAGKPVYELVDPNGRVFEMQSYSAQKAPQTMDSLAGLGEKLTLPAGWQLRSRVLDAELSVTAVNGVATVVQDDLANTYQLSRQAP